MMAILAQSATVDPISGGAGWVGAGLLGAVLAWLLLRHLPEKDKQTKEFSDKLVEVIKDNAKQTSELQSGFRVALKQIADHCETEMRQLTTGMLTQLQTLTVRVERLASDDHASRRKTS